jgi:hypothetical protein
VLLVRRRCQRKMALSTRSQTMPFCKSGFAFVGKGHIVGAQLIDGGSGDCAVKIYDTDDVNYAEAMKKEHLATASGYPVVYSQSVGTAPLFAVQKGCYVKLSGTAPQALVRIGMVDMLQLMEHVAAQEEEPLQPEVVHHS